MIKTYHLYFTVANIDLDMRVQAESLTEARITLRKIFAGVFIKFRSIWSVEKIES